MTDGKLVQNRVLLVEDQPLIAMDVEAMLSEHGFSNLEIATSASEALQLIETAPPDLALLDLNLGGETSLSVAEELAARAIPFVFATGYGDKSMIPPKLVAVPVVQKPFDPVVLTKTLRQALAARDGATG